MQSQSKEALVIKAYSKMNYSNTNDSCVVVDRINALRKLSDDELIKLINKKP